CRMGRAGRTAARAQRAHPTGSARAAGHPDPVRLGDCPGPGQDDPTARPGGVDYRTFVIVGTVGLLIPLTCAFAGIGVIVDRTTGARRELLAAPIPRGLIVAGNLTVAVLTSALRVIVLML